MSAVDRDLHTGIISSWPGAINKSVVAGQDELTPLHETVTGKDFVENLGNVSSPGLMNLVFIGHAMLQYDAFVEKDFLIKYQLEMGRVYSRARDETFVADFMKSVVGVLRIGAQGGALKCAEAAQWVLYNTNSVAFLGTAGGDVHLDTILHSVLSMHFAFKLETNFKNKSSMQFIIRCGKRWSEVNMFDRDQTSLSVHFIERPRVTQFLERSDIIFISGASYLLVNMDLRKFAYFASSRLKTMFMNIPGGVLRRGMEELLLNIIIYIDVFIISIRTALKLLQVFNITLPCSCCMWSSNLRIARAIHGWLKSLSKKACLVVIYEGIRTAYVASDLTSKHFHVKKYSSKFYVAHNVVDMCGCENAFAGGFAAQYLRDHEVKASVNCAFFCATAMATQMGSYFPQNRQELITMWKNNALIEEDQESRK